MSSLCFVSAVLIRVVSAQSPSDLVDKGMQAFCEGNVNESLVFFDEAKDAGYPPAQLWTRGISLYYLDRFEDGSKQFRGDVSFNPHDTEEAIWAFVCDAPTMGFKQAQQHMLKVQGEDRPYMQTLYSLFQGDGSVNESFVADKITQSPMQDAFYYSLYLGLFEEAKRDTAKARRWITNAASMTYATSSGDYMGAVARVHAKVRGWLNITASSLAVCSADGHLGSITAFTLV